MKIWLLPLILALPLFNAVAERIVTIGGDVSEITYALGVGSKMWLVTALA